MIVSHSKKFIFIHIYKVAGTSVRKALKPYADIKFRKYTPRRILYVLGLLQSIGEHATAVDIRQRLSPEVFDDYFKFAFVRNPWDWQVSLYHYICSHRWHPQHRRVAALRGFSEYVEWRIENDMMLQKDFVTDNDGQLLVDYLGRFESLTRDFNRICARIGIEARLPHKNPSQHHDYRQYYDDYTRELIEQYYAKDIAYFGYEYE